MKNSATSPLTQELLNELDFLGYTQELTVQEGGLFYEKKELRLTPTELFFVDAGYYNSTSDTYIFAITAPLYDLKAISVLTASDYALLVSTAYTQLSTVNIEEFSTEAPEVKINRQYGMRKIGKVDFDPERYVLRVGFPDFPPCPYGHTFKALGYDQVTHEYVRFASSILKSSQLITQTYAP